MRKFSLHIFSFILLSALIAGACKDEELFQEIGNYPTGGIRIASNIDEVLTTRSYIEQGPVNSGTFTFYYPYYISWIDGTSAYGKFQFLYNYAEVKFGYAGEEETGFVNAGTGTAPRELIWSTTNTGTSADDGMIYYPGRTNPSPVYLDNMPFRRRTTANTPNTDQLRDSILTLTDLEVPNPFKAGVFDFENGSNDLLWGTTGAISGEDKINVPMSHRMTRFVLNVIVDNTAETGMNINLNNAIVYIEGLLLNPLTYLRKHGELRFEAKINNNPPTLATEIDEKLYNTRVYLAGKPTDLLEDQPAPGTLVLDEDCTWSVAPEGIETANQLYTTKDFVFVPQDLRQGSTTRPRLVIAVPADDVNSGINEGYNQNYIYYRGGIPYTMNVYDDKGNGSMMTLNFMKGQVLRLTTQMKPGQPELEFAPVTVEPWVYKGTFTPNARQSGIFNGDDFANMVACYMDGDEFWLRKYGYLATSGANAGKWIFQFNQGNVKIDVLKVVGKMKAGEPTQDGSGIMPEYVFDFRNRDQFYVMPNGEEKLMGRTSENVLERIVTADVDKGVGNADDFSGLISAYQGNLWQMFLYGKYDLYEPQGNHHEKGKWTFKISDGITLDASVITAQMIPPYPEDSNFQFEIENNGEVMVSNYPSAGLTTSMDAAALYEIVTNRVPGIYSSSEFMALISAINSGDETALENYGYQQSGNSKWVLPLQRTLTLYTKDLQGAVRNSSIDFVFDLNGQKVNLMQYDNSNVNPTAEELKTLVGLNRVVGIDNTEAFSALMTSYNLAGDTKEQLSYYGYYNLNGPTWTFIFNDTMTLKRDAIQGMMKPEAPDKLNYSFDLNFKIIYLEDEEAENPEELFGNQGAEKLYMITSDTEEDDDDTGN